MAGRRLGDGRRHHLALPHPLTAQGRFRAQRQGRPLPRLRQLDVLVCAALHRAQDEARVRRRLRRDGGGAGVHPGLDRLSRLRGLRHARERYRRRPGLGRRAPSPKNPAHLIQGTERLLAAPIVPTLARLSAPGVLLVAFQSAVSIGDTYFVGRLGTAPLAGLALVFPLIMLLQMTSAGAMGGGVSSAIARAVGSGNLPAARRLVVHALVIAAGMGAAFTVLILLLGPAIYALLGGKDETLANAVRYSNVVFAGAITVWMANT